MSHVYECSTGDPTIVHVYECSHCLFRFEYDSKLVNDEDYICDNCLGSLYYIGEERCQQQ